MIPAPARERLCLMYAQVLYLMGEGKSHVRSKDIGALLKVSADTVRKDISFLGEAGQARVGYNLQKLAGLLELKLGLNQEHKACVVGLGRLGSALLAYEKFQTSGFKIVAGFDIAINVLETIKTSVDVFPMDRLYDVVKARKISLAIIATPASAAQQCAEQLTDAGIKGILNFAPAQVYVSKKDIFIRDIDVVNEMRFLASLLATHHLQRDTSDEQSD